MTDNTIISPDKYLGHRSYTNYKTYAEDAQPHHKHWVDGIPVVDELKTFVQELRVQLRLRNLRLCVDKSPSANIHHIDPDTGGSMTLLVWNTVGLVHPDVPKLRVGWVSFVNGAYVVGSEKIHNERFRRGSNGYNSKQSKDIAKMVKVARQYLKPFEFNEVQEAYSYVATSAVRDICGEARGKLHQKLSINQIDIATELGNMIAAGYAPVTDSFRAAAQLMQDEGLELRRLSNYKPRMCFLWSKENSLAYKYSDSSEPPVEITNLNDLPENLRNKRSVLSIAEEDSVIPDVGVRCTNKNYWVFV
jgi:hypothetical protein